MADEKKPGLLKRIFSFGFGKKKAEPEPENVIEDNSAAEAEAIEQAAAQKEADRLAAIKKAEEDALEAARLAAEKEAKAEAERKVAEEEAAAVAKAKAEEEAAEQKAREEAEAKRLAEKEAARIEAEKIEADRIKAEKLAAEEKAAAEKLEQARLAAEKADAEEAARLQIEAAKEVERLQAEREAAELAEKERLEAAALEKEQEDLRKAQDEEAAKVEAARVEEERIASEEAALKQAQYEADEKARLEAEKLEQERLEAEALQKAQEQEAVRLEEERLEAERLAAQAMPEPEQEEERKVGWFKRLTKGLARSSNALTENITSVFTKKKLDEDTLQELEDILIQADLGVETAMNITDTLASQRMGKDVTDEEVRQIMADEIEKVLEPVALPLELDLDHQPHVILVVGVNGSGKTTTIGKISQKLYNAGFSTLLVAGDTFRAAAVEQLHIWGDRTQAPVMSRPNGSDAAGLAYDAYTEAVEQKRDVMLMDTAGRLQNKKELMDELEKIIRVLKKQDPSAPHTVLLTLDATTGQNALNQVEIFKDVAGVNGLVMTKLDGTARGGILVSISAKHKLPVYFIGVGEQVEDLEPFEADVFAKAIAGIE